MIAVNPNHVFLFQPTCLYSTADVTVCLFTLFHNRSYPLGFSASLVRVHLAGSKIIRYLYFIEKYTLLYDYVMWEFEFTWKVMERKKWIFLQFKHHYTRIGSIPISLSLLLTSKLSFNLLCSVFMIKCSKAG